MILVLRNTSQKSTPELTSVLRVLSVNLLAHQKPSQWSCPWPRSPLLMHAADCGFKSADKGLEQFMFAWVRELQYIICRCPCWSKVSLFRHIFTLKYTTSNKAEIMSKQTNRTFMYAVCASQWAMLKKCPLTVLLIPCLLYWTHLVSKGKNKSNLTYMFWRYLFLVTLKSWWNNKHHFLFLNGTTKTGD